MRGLVWLSLAATLLLAAVVILTPLVVVAEHAEAVVAAAAICIGAGWIAMTPPLLAMSLFPDHVMQAGTASVGLRLLVTLGVGMAYYAWAKPVRSPFMTTLVVWYLGLLVVETGLTVFLARRHWASPGIETN